MKITEFDKPKCRVVGYAVEEALKEVGVEFGIRLKYKGGSFTSTNCTVKIEASVIREDGTVITREADDFKRYCGLYNLLPEDLGKTIPHDGDSFQIVGLAMKSHKYPILATNLKNGKIYKLKEAGVQRALGRKVTGFDQFVHDKERA